MRRRALRRAGALLAVGLLLAGCQSPEEQLEQHVQAAAEYREQDMHREALIELKAALKLEPQNAEINVKIAQALMALERYEPAIFYFQEAYRLDPQQLGAALEAAYLMRFVDTDRATELTNEVIEKDPSYVLAHVRRSEIALVRGDLEDALVAALTAVELAPQSPVAHLGLGLVHQARLLEARSQGERPADEIFLEALAAFDRVIAADTRAHEGRAMFERARVLAAWPGHTDEARTAYRELVEYAFETAGEATRVPAARNAARFAQSIGDDEMTRWALEKILEADPQQVWAWRALAAFDQQDGGSGEATLERMLEALPDDPEAHRTYALYLASSGRRDAAVAHVNQAIEDGVEPSALLSLLARMHFEADEPEPANAVLARLRSEYPDAPATREVEALAAMADGRLEDAAEILEKLVELQESQESQFLLASIRFRQRRIGPATDAIERAEELASGFDPRIQRLKLQIDAEAERWVDVLRTLNQLRRRGRQPRPAELVMRAQALYALNRDAAGRRVLEQVLAAPEPPLAAVLEFVRREWERQPERAYELLAAAHERYPRHPTLLRRLSAADVERGEPERALARIDRLIEETGGAVAPVTYLDRARLLASQERYEDAERDLLLVLQRVPQYRPASELLVAVYEAQGELEEAIASFEEADRAGALSAESRVVLSRLYARFGRIDDAVAALERAIRDRSDLPGAKADLAFLLAQEGRDLDRALELAQEARSGLGQDPSATDALGLVYLKKGLADVAADQFAYAIELASGAGQPSALFHYHHGLALKAMDRPEEARRAFEAALELDADFPEAREEMAGLPPAASAQEG